jgi:hypothetical protein
MSFVDSRILSFRRFRSSTIVDLQALSAFTISCVIYKTFWDAVALSRFKRRHLTIALWKMNRPTCNRNAHAILYRGPVAGAVRTIQLKCGHRPK